VEVLMEKERQVETSKTIKIDGFFESPPPWMVMYFFVSVFFNLALLMTKLRYWCFLFQILPITLLYCNTVKQPQTRR
jgi:hypothetical protein